MRSVPGREPGPGVGLAENVVTGVPIIETPEHIRAAEMATRELNAAYLTVMLEGSYTDAYLEAAGADAPKFTPEDLKVIASPVDFVGINVYVPNWYVRAIDDAPGYALLPFSRTHPRMQSPWHLIGPEALYWAPRHVHKLWKAKEIYVTENGCGAADDPSADGIVYDSDRDHVLAQLSHPVAARDLGRRSGARVLPLEPDGQFRVV